MQLSKKEQLTHEFFADLQENLRKNFPTLKELDMNNLLYMRQFAKEYLDVEFVQEVLGQLPWGHIVLLFTYVQNSVSRRW